MQLNNRCAAVIPCHNEAATIAVIVGAVRQYVPVVIVVDDGSADHTADEARRAGAQVIRHSSRLGKGAALRTGLSHARGLGFERAITLDGDGQHAPADIPGFFNFARTNQAPLIVGNRMPQAHKIPFVRRWVNRGMSWILSHMSGVDLPDSQCGFRLMDLEAWAGLNTRAHHFEIESELLLAFSRAGHAIRFMPVEVIYRDERSKIAPLRDTLRWFVWLRHARRLA